MQNAQWCHVCQWITGFTHYLHHFLCLFQQCNCISQILSVIMTYRTVPATTCCIFQSLQFPFVAYSAPLVEFSVFAFSLLTWNLQFTSRMSWNELLRCLGTVMYSLMKRMSSLKTCINYSTTLHQLYNARRPSWNLQPSTHTSKPLKNCTGIFTCINLP